MSYAAVFHMISGRKIKVPIDASTYDQAFEVVSSKLKTAINYGGSWWVSHDRMIRSDAIEEIEIKKEKTSDQNEQDRN